MAWVTPTYLPQRVNAAGRALVSSSHADILEWGDEEWREYSDHIAVLNNWRSSHAYPLNTLQMNLRGVTRRLDDSAVVAQRIKRLSSIAHKLDRFPSMKLSQMQDLGGCRAILNSASTVQEVADYYTQRSSMKHARVSHDDYMANPKPSGYRGVHLVYRYHSEGQKAAYNGLKIEMQLRSRYQHAWATAVETVGTFSGQALKSSLGSESWQRFFALSSSLIAFRERLPVVPGTPNDRESLLEELKGLMSELRVVARLREYSRALKDISAGAARMSGHQIYLLQLDPEAGALRVTGYSSENRVHAERDYAEAELFQRKRPSFDTVLVSVGSLASLQRAYPNYFADTRVFLELVSQAMRGRSRGIDIKDRQLRLAL